MARLRGFTEADLLLVADSTSLFPLSGSSQTCNFKLLHLPTRETIETAYNSSGKQVPLEKLWQAERKARESVFGKLNPALSRRLALSNPDDAVRVAFWLGIRTQSRPQLSLESSDEQVQSAVQAIETGLRRAVAEVAGPFSQRVFEHALGSVQAFDSWPLVIASVPSKWVQALASDLSVLEVYLMPDDPVLRYELLYTQHQASTQLEPAHQQGWMGDGQRIAVYEFGTPPARTSTSNPYIPPFIPLPSSAPSSLAAENDHIAGVLGVIRNNEPSIGPGYSPRGGILYGGQQGVVTEFKYPTLIDEAITMNARVHSLSIGTSLSEPEPTSSGIALVPDGKVGLLGRLLDAATQERGATVVASVGNTRHAKTFEFKPAPWAGKVWDPATAYQVIGVGGTFVQQSGVSMFDDPNKSIGSSYVNPVGYSDDREKPDVVAPAVQLALTADAVPLPFISNKMGTSLAAPAVAGFATLLHQKMSVLRVWPEVTRAAIVAGAFNNIEGRAQRSDEDGAGGINVARTIDMSALTLRFQGLDGECSQIPKIPASYSIPLPGGKHVRAAIAFDSSVNYPNYSSETSADLDLLVWRIRPDGSEEFMGSSQTWSGTFEVVDFNTTTTSLYRFEVARFRCLSSPRYLGFSLAME